MSCYITRWHNAGVPNVGTPDALTFDESRMDIVETRDNGVIVMADVWLYWFGLRRLIRWTIKRNSRNLVRIQFFFLDCYFIGFACYKISLKFIFSGTYPVTNSRDWLSCRETQASVQDGSSKSMAERGEDVALGRRKIRTRNSRERIYGMQMFVK